MEKVNINLGGSRKRKRGERIFQFESFCEPGTPTHFNGPFLENIWTLLGFGHAETKLRDGMRCWSFQLEVNQNHLNYVKLYITEEEVETSLYRECHYCRSIGWSAHMISSKRFHFLLPGKETICELVGSNHESTCKRSDKVTLGSVLMDLKGHLMHGVVHSNGFGHLLSINGIEGGSGFIPGHKILDLWDRICNGLHLWKVSLVDTARKGSMDLRLIHGISYNQPWFGRWGYRFGRGSYGVTEQTYQNSLQALQSLPIRLLIPHFTCTTGGHDIPMIATKYQAICSHPLLTLGDLIWFMSELKSRIPLESRAAVDYRGIITETSCRWSMKRVDMAVQVIVESLKKSELRWVTRQEVRDAARAYIGDTGLLDYVLKSLSNHIVGNCIVRREVNPVTKVLEYCLEDVSTDTASGPGRIWSKSFQVTRTQLRKDMTYLYKHILRGPATTAASGTIPIAVRNILDTKHLVKEYCNKQALHHMQTSTDDDSMRLMCTVRVKSTCNHAMPPYDIIVVAGNANSGELKKEVEKHFREVYLGLKGFEAEEVVGCSDSDLVAGVVTPGDVVIVEGEVKMAAGGGGGEMYEGGGGGGGGGLMECGCGAKEEDGERMVSCDICEVRQHTRCVGISDGDEMPRVFLCSRCESDIVAFPLIHY